MRKVQKLGLSFLEKAGRDDPDYFPITEGEYCMTAGSEQETAIEIPEQNLAAGNAAGSPEIVRNSAFNGDVVPDPDIEEEQDAVPETERADIAAGADISTEEETAHPGDNNLAGTGTDFLGEMAGRYQEGLSPEKRYQLTDRARAVMEFFEKRAQGVNVGKEDYPAAFQGPDWDYGGTRPVAAVPVPAECSGVISEKNPEEMQKGWREVFREEHLHEDRKAEIQTAEKFTEAVSPWCLPPDVSNTSSPDFLSGSGKEAAADSEAVTLDKTEDNLGNCPECGSPLSLYRTRRGQMAGCSRYPACRYMKPVAGIYRVRIEEIIPDSACPVCGSPMAVKSGRYGQFVGCTNYPDCTYIFREKPERLPCPECLKGNLMLRKTRFQKVFWSCDRYPDCTCRLNRKPVRRHCTHCKSPVLTEFRGRQGGYLRCPLCGKKMSRTDR